MRHFRPGRWIGLLLIVAPIGAELWRERPDDGGHGVRTIAEPVEAPRDHLQIWVLVHGDDALARPIAIHERVVPASTRSSFSVPELELEGTMNATRIDSPDPSMSGRLVTGSSFPPSRHQSEIGQVDHWVDVGDGRRFAVLASHLNLAASMLPMTPRQPHASVLARTVNLEELAEPVPDHRHFAALERQMRFRQSPPGLRADGVADPVFRLARHTAPGAWVFGLGLLMLLGGSMWRRLAITGFVFCFSLSLLERAHLGRDLARLADPDVGTRIAAAARLASNPLFPARAADALQQAIRTETSPEAKSEMYRALARSTKTCARHESIASLLEESSESEAEVRKARRELVESLERAREIEEEMGVDG